MLSICPTITADSDEKFRDQLKRVSPFAKRLHIDIADGTLAPRKLLPISKMHLPHSIPIDFHIMCREPLKEVKEAVTKKPNLVIVHAEEYGDFDKLAHFLREHKIKVGVALLQATQAEVIEPVLGLIDHVLIFSGNFGYQGGSHADLTLLDKVKTLKKLKPELEFGWDGGVKELNIKDIAKGGVEVINVGGYIQQAPDPRAAYAKLKKAV